MTGDENTMLRIGLHGCGPIAQFAHLPALAKARRIQLTAICDAAEDLLQIIGRQTGVELLYTSYDEMLVKAQLASKICDIIKRGKLTQAQAAEILGIPQPKLSGLLRGQFRGISEAKMMDCLTKLGRDIRIVVGPARRAASEGSVKVVFG